MLYFDVFMSSCCDLCFVEELSTKVQQLSKDKEYLPKSCFCDFKYWWLAKSIWCTYGGSTTKGIILYYLFWKIDGIFENLDVLSTRALLGEADEFYLYEVMQCDRCWAWTASGSVMITPSQVGDRCHCFSLPPYLASVFLLDCTCWSTFQTHSNIFWATAGDKPTSHFVDINVDVQALPLCQPLE